ncbi:lysine-specific demethylase 9 [Limanda limanda]|uniref:lysine-specific demethylase 9 n=1 Tax=Limanda limanda TaxID=27771 RepID=UPI0029C9A6BA|nr:lysine-specific demethylase 9 [Limanda limanda]
MLSHPLSQTESDNRGRGLSAVTPPPVLSLVEPTGVFSSSPPPSARSSSPPHTLLSSPSPFTRLRPLSPPNPMFLTSSPPVPHSHLSSSTLPPPSSSSSSISTSSPPAPPSVSHPSPPHLLSPHSLHHPPSFSSAPHPPHVHHHSSCLVSPLPSSLCSPVSSSNMHLPPLIPPPPPPPPPPHPTCCSCSSLLPRLLSAHRLEVRRLLRGALASLGRRLDTLERRSRRNRQKKKKSMTGGEGGAWCQAPAASSAASFSCSYSCISAVLPPVSSSLSSSVKSESEESFTSPALSGFDQSEQRRAESRGHGDEVRRRKRKNKDVVEEEEEEEDAGRFVGQMAVSFRGGGGGAEKEEGPITLHNFNHKKHRGGGTSQSEKTVSVVRQNGFRPLLLHGVLSSSSQNDVHLLQSAQSLETCSQSEAFAVSPSQWWFSDSTPRLTSDLSAFGLWLRSSSSSFNPASILRFSVVTVETIMDSVRGGTCGNPPRPLKDWSAPPSVSSDHCYMRTPSPSLTFSTRRQHKQRSTRSPHLPWRRPLPLPPCSANGLSAPFTGSQSAASSEFLNSKGERCKRVSEIRIRRTTPRETLLTPMGLPKVKRLKKKEFSLEEIYTNKNYKSPTTNRSLETIFEEPREKDGGLLLIGQQRRRRLLLFPDFTQPRKRKRPQGAWFPGGTFPRKRAAARRHCNGDGCGEDDMDLDVMLVERLSALEDFLTQQGLDE